MHALPIHHAHAGKGHGSVGKRWISDENVAEQSNERNRSSFWRRNRASRHRSGVFATQSKTGDRQKPRIAANGPLIGSEDSGNPAAMSAVALGNHPLTSSPPSTMSRVGEPRRGSLDPLAAEEMAAVLRSGKVSALAAYAGESDPAQIAGFLEDEGLANTYVVEQIIAEGGHWTMARVSRRQDRKQLLIKKIIKAQLPEEEQYFQPCEGNKSCQCIKCAPWITTRPPIELVLLQSRDSGLPQLVDSVEDERNYYLITKLHGPSQKRWKHIWSWFGRNRWSTVYWREYLT